jgi:dipeptidyl-peptidase 4
LKRNDPALRRLVETENHTLGRPSSVQLAADGSAAFFLRTGPKNRCQSLFSFDLRTREERCLFDVTSVQDQTARSFEEQAELERLRVRAEGLTRYALSPDAKSLFVPYQGHLYEVQRKTGKRRCLPIVSGGFLGLTPSPCGRWLAFARDHNLFIYDRARKQARALTKHGTAATPVGTAEFVAQEEMGRMEGFWWSPDGEQLAFQETDHAGMDGFVLHDPSQPEFPARRWPYPRAGRPNADVRLFVTSPKIFRPREILWNRKQFPYLARVIWRTSNVPTLLLEDRLQKNARLLSADLKTGKTRALVELTDPSFLNLPSGTPCWVESGNALLLATEASGFWQLLRYEDQGGRMTSRAIVDADAGFRSLVHLDPKRNVVFFSGGPNPRETHLFRKSLSTGKTDRLTDAPGEYTAHISENGRTLALFSESLTNPRRLSLHDLSNTTDRIGKGYAVGRPMRIPGQMPNVKLVPPDHAAGLSAAVVLPSQLERKKKYPTILYVYGGPHVNLVKHSVHGFLFPAWLAEQGFVVVMIDGRGTPRRGRDFERAVYQQFDAVPLADQIAGLQALVTHHPEIDVSRVGIYGWSFGGYLAAQGILERPDIFQAAVAGAPVTDWTYYDTHYTERYLGHPDTSPEAYRKASLLPLAKKLKKPLLLIHGMSDDNVFCAHTLKLADALFRAERPFSCLPLANTTHQLSDPKTRALVYRRTLTFFEDHL